MSSNQLTQKTVLDNGLAVVTGYVSDQATNTTEIKVHIGSGSSDDSIDGEAHFLEHMLFNGVETSNGIVDFKTLKQERERKGILFNAYTSFAETVYMATVPTHLGQKGIEDAVQELSRMVVTPTLPEERVEHEKRVIHNEWGSRLSDLNILLNETNYVAAFSKSPEYGHLILGQRDTITQITRDSLVNFMAAHYTAPNLTVSIAGPVNHDDITALVAKEFADISDQQRPDFPEEPALQPVYQAIDLNIIPHAYFHISMIWEGVDDYERELTVQMAQAVIGNHLFDTVREDKGSTYRVNTGSIRLRESGMLTIATDTDPSNVEAIMREISHELNALVTGDISALVDRVKTDYKNGRESVPMNSEYMSNNLMADQVNFGMLYDIEEHAKLAEAVRPEDIQAVIKQALEGQINMIGLAPEGTFPDEATFKQIMRLRETPQTPSLGQRFNV